MEVFPAVVVVVVVVVTPFAANIRGRVVEVFEESKPPDTQASRRPDALLDWTFAQVQVRENLAHKRLLFVDAEEVFLYILCERWDTYARDAVGCCDIKRFRDHREGRVCTSC